MLSGCQSGAPWLRDWAPGDGTTVWQDALSIHKNKWTGAVMRKFRNAVVTTLAILCVVPIALLMLDVEIIALAWPDNPKIR